MLSSKAMIVYLILNQSAFPIQFQLSQHDPLYIYIYIYIY